MIKSTTRVRQLRAEFTPSHLSRLDQRSREARLLKDFRRAMTDHIGGHPTPVQVSLIERAAQLQLRLAIFDAKFAEIGEMTDHISRMYLAWSNSLARTLALLGLEGSPKPAPAPLTPREIIDRAIAAREVKGAPAHSQKDSDL